MVCTNDDALYDALRIYRSHGMVREAAAETKDRYQAEHPDLNPDFIFAFPAYNVRGTELNAVIGRNQLKRLDDNNAIRTRNLKLFLNRLDPSKYQTDFAVEGSSNYALTLILRSPDKALRGRVEKTLRELKVEFRRGTAGGGNQLGDCAGGVDAVVEVGVVLAEHEMPADFAAKHDLLVAHLAAEHGVAGASQDGDAPAVRLLLRSGPSGAVAQSTEIIRIDGRTWLRPGEGGWGEAGRVSLPPEQMSHATLAANVAAGLDPLGAVARYPDAVLVADAADDAVDGTPTVHYTLVVDLVRAAATETDPARRTALQAQQQAGLTRLSAEIWVDAERRPLRSRVRQQLPDGAALDALVRYDGWGAPITIEPPVRG